MKPIDIRIRLEVERGKILSYLGKFTTHPEECIWDVYRSTTLVTIAAWQTIEGK